MKGASKNGRSNQLDCAYLPKGEKGSNVLLCVVKIDFSIVFVYFDSSYSL